MAFDVLQMFENESLSLVHRMTAVECILWIDLQVNPLDVITHLGNAVIGAHPPLADTELSRECFFIQFSFIFTALGFLIYWYKNTRKMGYNRLLEEKSKASRANT